MQKILLLFICCIIPFVLSACVESGYYRYDSGRYYGNGYYNHQYHRPPPPHFHHHHPAYRPHHPPHQRVTIDREKRRP